MRSSQETEGKPAAASFCVQKVLPEPDMPMRASRKGVFNVVAIEEQVTSYDSAAAAYTARSPGNHRPFAGRDGAVLAPVPPASLRGCAVGVTLEITLARRGAGEAHEFRGLAGLSRKGSRAAHDGKIEV